MASIEEDGTPDAPLAQDASAAGEGQAQEQPSRLRDRAAQPALRVARAMHAATERTQARVERTQREVEASGELPVSESRAPQPEAPEVHVPSMNPRTLLVRMASGAVYVAVSVLAILWGRVPTAIVMSLTAAVTCWEFFRMMRADAKLPNQPIGILFALLLPLTALTSPVYLIGVVFLLLMFLGIWYVANLRVRITDVAVTLFGVLYTSLMLCAIVMIRAADLPAWGAAILTIGVMMSVWANDSFAYLVGSCFGRHPLVPKISPKKSWEGLAGGIVGSVVVWLVLALIPMTHVTLPVALVAGVACGVTGVIGDLVESRIKRGAGVKDSGNLIPGHGGLLDRSDSMLFVSIAAYFILRLMGVI